MRYTTTDGPSKDLNAIQDGSLGDIMGIADITQAWKWANYDIIDAKKALDSLISKRGDAAHRANTAAKKNCDVHLVKRDELEKAIRFLKGLVEATDQYKITK